VKLHGFGTFFASGGMVGVAVGTDGGLTWLPDGTAVFGVWFALEPELQPAPTNTRLAANMAMGMKRIALAKYTML
jgi:hypothetical protein